MHYRHLGKSGLQVSEIALGSWLNVGGWVDEKASIALIHQAYAAGVNLIDVADVYADGQAEVALMIGAQRSTHRRLRRGRALRCGLAALQDNIPTVP